MNPRKTGQKIFKIASGAFHRFSSQPISYYAENSFWVHYLSTKKVHCKTDQFSTSTGTKTHWGVGPPTTNRRNIAYARISMKSKHRHKQRLPTSSLRTLSIAKLTPTSWLARPILMAIRQWLRTGKGEPTEAHPPIDVFTLPSSNNPLLLVGQEENRRILSDGPTGPIKAKKEWGSFSHRPFNKVRIVMDIGNPPLCGCKFSEWNDAKIGRIQHLHAGSWNKGECWARCG